MFREVARSLPRPRRQKPSHFRQIMTTAHRPEGEMERRFDQDISDLRWPLVDILGSGKPDAFP